MSKNDNYILIKFLEIRFADPISALKLVNNYVVTGTMMGRINLYNISEKKQIPLSELNSENISDISYNEKEKCFYVAIGDEEIKLYFIKQSSDTIEDSSINVYDSDLQHSKYCDDAYILLSPESLFRIQLPHINEGILKIVTIDSEYEIKYFDSENEFQNYGNIKTTLPTTNYTVPFDFDGKKFLWVEFLSSTQRNICVANIPLLQEDKPQKFDLNRNIGHISQAKLLPNDRVFIVHSLNKCEIRALDNKFTLLEQFQHIGEEILAVDIVFNEENENNISSENIIYNKNKLEKINLKNNEKKEEIEYKKNKDEINTKRIMETSDNVNKNRILNKEEDINNFGNNKKNIKKENIIDIKDIYIITLDIDGNVNLFKNKSENTLFNLYNLSTIPQDHKDKHFFSMGYAYYIKANLKYFCISSDHGCYIIKYNNE